MPETKRIDEGDMLYAFMVRGNNHKGQPVVVNGHMTAATQDDAEADLLAKFEQVVEGLDRVHHPVGDDVKFDVWPIDLETLIAVLRAHGFYVAESMPGASTS